MIDKKIINDFLGGTFLITKKFLYYFLLLFAGYLIYLFMALYYYVPLAKSAMETNEKLGYGIKFEYSWMGVKVEPYGTPSQPASVPKKEIAIENLSDIMSASPVSVPNGLEGEAIRPALDLVVSSPLEQFTILPLIPIQIGDLYFSFTNPSLFMLLTLSLVVLLLHFVTKKGGGTSVPNVWQSLVELIYDFVLNPVNEQIGGLSGNVKQKFSPRISVTFTFSLFRNLQGMIPYSFTVTSHFLITLGLSFSIFIGITIVGFQRNGLHFLSIFLPAGVPLPLAPFLVLLELISHCFRALSSGIRLFANMMAGHSSVKILSGFAWTMLCMHDLLYFIGDLGPLFIVLALTGLELGVAILQAHVFTILICIYLNDAINLHQSAYFFIIEQKRGSELLSRVVNYAR